MKGTKRARPFSLALSPLRRERGALVVFLGPSLPLKRARACCRGTFWPPARQGDVFRALSSRPRAIALIDGVFEAQPSVWHHELRAALSSGVAVFGAASMGALRACELATEGMIGVGEIARRYASGEWIDDADVALLHGSREHGFRPLTLPVVNVVATAERAVEAGVLRHAAAASLVAAARAIFYQERQWSVLLSRWPVSEAQRARFGAWVRTHAVDLKARDAEECLRTAETFLRARAGAPPPAPFRASSFVRRRRLLDAHAAALLRLERRADRRELEDAGTRRLLLAAFARLTGYAPAPEAIARRAASLRIPGLADDERASVAEALLLEEAALTSPERFVCDGPARREALALEAQLRGLWKE